MFWTRTWESMLPSYVWVPDLADLAETISAETVGRRLARAIRGKGANVSADERRAMLDRFPESERRRTIAHAWTERSAAA